MHDPNQEELGQLLLQIARRSAEAASRGEPMPELWLDELPQELQEERATFVTLYVDGELNGCLGALEAHCPLAEDVNRNAYRAATRDPRFYPLRPQQLDQLTLHVSVLTPMERLDVHNEQELLEILRPNIDGLVFEAGPHRGTFLPSVWEKLPNPHDFLEHLRLKAGLPPGSWPHNLEVYRYTTTGFEGTGLADV